MRSLALPVIFSEDLGPVAACYKHPYFLSLVNRKKRTAKSIKPLNRAKKIESLYIANGVISYL
jgi:hypothetical protein